MALTVTTSFSEQDIDIVCDGYVPLIAQVVRQSTSRLVYWRVGDFCKTLVEIGIEPTTGLFCKLKVISIPRPTDGQMWDMRQVPTQQGLPAFDIAHVEPTLTRIEEVCTIDACWDAGILSIRLGANMVACSAIRCGRVVFVLDAHYHIAGVEVLDMTHDEEENFRFTLGEP